MTTSDLSASARPLTIAESALLLETCERVVSLLALDEMWTDYLTAARESRIAEVDFSGLLGLSEPMLDGLGELGETGQPAADVVSSQSDEVLIAGLRVLSDQYGRAELFDWARAMISQAVGCATSSFQHGIGSGKTPTTNERFSATSGRSSRQPIFATPIFDCVLGGSW